jgi:hypothetical protein
MYVSRPCRGCDKFLPLDGRTRKDHLLTPPPCPGLYPGAISKLLGQNLVLMSWVEGWGVLQILTGHSYGKDAHFCCGQFAVASL